MYSILPAILWLLFSVNEHPVDIITAVESVYLTDLYKDLHQNPEVSLHEERTAQRLAIELSLIHI